MGMTANLRQRMIYSEQAKILPPVLDASLDRLVNYARGNIEVGAANFEVIVNLKNRFQLTREDAGSVLELASE